jgi:hypothetical protein
MVERWCIGGIFLIKSRRAAAVGCAIGLAKAEQQNARRECSGRAQIVSFYFVNTKI